MFGLEEILAEELRKLGAQNVKLMNRAVSFKGDKGFMYKANLNLRTALRILSAVLRLRFALYIKPLSPLKLTALFIGFTFCAPIFLSSSANISSKPNMVFASM